MTLDISTIDAKDGQAETLVDQLRKQLSPQGDIVSDAGRARTIELFGEPLSPQQVVDRICDDVAKHGLDAVLDYAGYSGLLDFQEETANSVADALASELETEIEWYVDYNCTE